MPPENVFSFMMMAIGVIILAGATYGGYCDRRDAKKRRDEHVDLLAAENKELRSHIKELRAFRDVVVSHGIESQKSDDSVEAY